MSLHPKAKKKSNWFLLYWRGDLPYSTVLIYGLLVQLIAINGCVYFVNAGVSYLNDNNDDIIAAIALFAGNYLFADATSVALFLKKQSLHEYYGLAAPLIKLGIVIGVLLWGGIGGWRASKLSSNSYLAKGVFILKRLTTFVITVVIFLLFCCFSGHQNNLLFSEHFFISTNTKNFLSYSTSNSS